MLITRFFYKNLFYKNAQAEINQTLKNILRTYPSQLTIFILLIFSVSSINKRKRNAKL